MIFRDEVQSMNLCITIFHVQTLEHRRFVPRQCSYKDTCENSGLLLCLSFISSLVTSSQILESILDPEFEEDRVDCACSITSQLAQILWIISSDNNVSRQKQLPITLMGYIKQSRCRTVLIARITQTEVYWGALTAILLLFHFLPASCGFCSGCCLAKSFLGACATGCWWEHGPQGLIF